MQLDRTTPTLTPLEFINHWRGTQLKERSASQSHFNELCRMLGSLASRLSSGGKLLVAKEGATRQTVKKRLNAAADAIGKKFSFLRSSSETVRFRAVE